MAARNNITEIHPLKLALFALVFLLLSILVPWQILREVEGQVDGLWQQLLTPQLLLPALALLALFYLSDALRLWFTLRALKQQLRPSLMLPLVFLNQLFSGISPMATGGGVIQLWYLHRHGVHLGVATAATTLRTLFATMMVFLPAPVLLLVVDQLQIYSMTTRWMPVFILVVAAYVVFILGILWRLHWFIHALTGLLALLHRSGLIGEPRLRRWRFKARRELMRFGYSFRAFIKADLSDIVLALLTTLLYLLTQFSFPALLLWGLGYPVDYPLVLVLMLINTFIMYFAPTPGAAGIAEGVFTLFFAALVEQRDLFLLVVTWRFFTIHLGMLIGVPVTLYALFRQHHLR